MVALAAGTVVLVPFPFSDLSQSKIRPALVLARASYEDWILCQITSRPYSDSNAVELKESRFASGSLKRTSYARPGKLFTANYQIVVSHVGVLKSDVHERIITAIIEVLRKGVKGTMEKP